MHIVITKVSRNRRAKLYKTTKLMGEGNKIIKKILSPKWARKEKKGI